MDRARKLAPRRKRARGARLLLRLLLLLLFMVFYAQHEGGCLFRPMPRAARASAGERRFGWQLARGFIRASCQPAAKGREMRSGKAAQHALPEGLMRCPGRGVSAPRDALSAWRATRAAKGRAPRPGD